MFGCICPNNHMKKRCDRIFAMVNHNPCVDSTSTTISTSTGTSAPVADHVEGADDWLEEFLTGAADWPTKDGTRTAGESFL
nr:unnamed protein product [Callosobruchus analis]